LDATFARLGLPSVAMATANQLRIGFATDFVFCHPLVVQMILNT